MGRRGESIRRCILTGEERSARAMIRLVADPEGQLIPDISGRLPGRGIWVQASRSMLGRAVEDGSFARAAAHGLKQRIKANGGLVGLTDVIEAGLERRCLELLGMARGAGAVSLGFEKALRAVKKGGAGCVFVAADASRDSVGKLLAAANAAGCAISLIELFDRAKLSAALGAENVVFAAITGDGFAGRIGDEALRLAAFRGKALRAVSPEERNAPAACHVAGDEEI